MNRKNHMIISNSRIDRLLFAFLLIIAIGVPVSLQVYNGRHLDDRIDPQAKVFTLTGHMEKGWIPGEVKAWEAVTFQGSNLELKQPVIRVKKGDRVVLKLTSSDVIHGFSLKDFGIFITDGILPGKVKLVSFTADKIGTFTFTCNAICGKKHEQMKGTIIVTA
jgi:heme/copper-type cytochrome/quinol oxidase subunit 2